ncbi:methyltransferase domain-containing protein [Nonomuraea sp. NPDC049419]|uniref:class I SAM-dependent methyltransferase n=1 Tax=Nonomuraea sp. NPDC049419 TaxID=3155772 RepID=UPI003444C9CF
MTQTAHRPYNVRTAPPKEAVRQVYEFISAEYDDRIPGLTPADRRFTDTELDFILGRVGPEDSVLDLGCGTGRLTLPLAALAKEVVGLDLCDGMLAVARRKAEEEGADIRFDQGDMCDLPYPDDSFDVVTSTLALMHIPLEARGTAFAEIARVLRPGGRLLTGVKNAAFEQLTRADRFATVDITDVDNKTLVFTGTRDGEQREAPWFSFTPDELEELFSDAGLRPARLRGNCVVAAWMADQILADPGIYAIVERLETALNETPPFSRFGYYILAEAVKPA